MLILTIKTDQPQAEIAIFDNQKPLASHSWQAHRQLAESIHTVVNQVLKEAGKGIHNIEGLVVYKGPGSFTGLRIGVSVANALADTLGAAIVSTSGPRWQQSGIEKLLGDLNERLASPDYGAPAKTTIQKK